MDLQLIDETKHVTDHQLDLVRGVLEYAANYLSLPENTEMSVTLMDNKHIHEINKKYRGIDKPTDVISFAMEEDGDEGDIILPRKGFETFEDDFKDDAYQFWENLGTQVRSIVGSE